MGTMLRSSTSTTMRRFLLLLRNRYWVRLPGKLRMCQLNSRHGLMATGTMLTTELLVLLMTFLPTSSTNWSLTRWPCRVRLLPWGRMGGHKRRIGLVENFLLLWVD